jgi:hypothetical protein
MISEGSHQKGKKDLEEQPNKYKEDMYVRFKNVRNVTDPKAHCNSTSN